MSWMAPAALDLEVTRVGARRTGRDRIGVEAAPAVAHTHLEHAVGDAERHLDRCARAGALLRLERVRARLGHGDEQVVDPITAESGLDGGAGDGVARRSDRG